MNSHSEVAKAVEQINFVRSNLLSSRVINGTFPVDDSTCCRWVNALLIALARLDDALAQDRASRGAAAGVAEGLDPNDADMVWLADDGESFAHSISDMMQTMYDGGDYQNGDTFDLSIAKSAGNVTVRMTVDASENVDWELVAAALPAPTQGADREDG